MSNEKAAEDIFPPKPSADAKLRAVLVNTIAIVFCIDNGIIPGHQALDAIKGMALAYDEMTTRWYGKNALVPKIEARVKELADKIERGEL